MRTGFYTAAEPLARSGVGFRERFVHRLRAVSGLGLLNALALAALFLGASIPAHAVDGCKVLLCMAGNWQRIAPCEPTVRQALRDVARGRSWPQCGMSGNSETANRFVPPVNCPEQYRTEVRDWNDQVAYTCPYSGVVLVAVEGQPWTRTWWSMDGDAVTEWLPAARAALAARPDAMDTRFDDDHAAWVISERLRLAPVPEPLNPGS